MLLLQLVSGKSIRVDPSLPEQLNLLDGRDFQRRIRRVAVMNERGTRIDLPVNKDGQYYLWVEQVKKGDEIKGESVCMRNSKILFRVIHYYSDGRFVTDVDTDGGFR